MISSTIVAIALIVGSVSSVSAQSYELSSQCQSTLSSIATSPEASCLNLAGFIPFASIDANASLVAPINTWFTDFCSQSACTNQSLATVVETVISGCSIDLNSAGQTNYTVEYAITAIQNIYPTARKIACLKDNSVNQLCSTELFTNIESKAGTLTGDNLVSVMLDAAFATGPLDTATVTSGICSRCGKQLYNTINNDFPNYWTSDVNSTYQNLCGTSFTDGTQPSVITQTANGLTSA